MTDTPTAEEIAQHYTAMGHSVDYAKRWATRGHGRC